MAKATVITPKPARQPPKKVILELSEGEADSIQGITGWVGGSMNSPRKYNESIQDALSEALDTNCEDTDAHSLLMECDSDMGLHFNDYPRKS